MTRVIVHSEHSLHCDKCLHLLTGLLHAGIGASESLLDTTEVLYNLMVVYAFAQACALLLMLISFIQRW